MINSNYTLRFPRTYREATGEDAHFEQRNPDRWVFLTCVVLTAFVLGMVVGDVLP